MKVNSTDSSQKAWSSRFGFATHWQYVTNLLEISSLAAASGILSIC